MSWRDWDEAVRGARITDLRAAFTCGYTSVRPWPETRDGQVATCIAARQLELISLVCHSDDPSFVAYLPTMLDKGVRRLATWLDG